MDQMRNIKRPGEIEVLRRNGRISALGDKQAIAIAHPGHVRIPDRSRSRVRLPQRRRAGSGLSRDRRLRDCTPTPGITSSIAMQITPGSIVVFDFAADLDHMTMDITRTFNIDGKFTPEQAKWYNVDLESPEGRHRHAEGRATPTSRRPMPARRSSRRQAKARSGWDFPGHFVGLATHDVMMPKGPIQAGQVVTVEPIVEFPDKHWHFRVEDTILITANGPEILVVRDSERDGRRGEAGGQRCPRRRRSK